MPLLTTSGNEKPDWAIVIHGGAGSDPQNWTEDKTRIREAGLKRALEAGSKALADGRSALDTCLLYTSPSPRDVEESRMPSSA